MKYASIIASLPRLLRADDAADYCAGATVLADLCQRFGVKPALQKKGVIVYDRFDLDDAMQRRVAHHELVEHARDLVFRPRPRRNQKKPSSVYIFKAGAFYKIGIAADVPARAYRLRTGCPFPIEIIATVEVEKPHLLEQAIHRKYADCRRHGEWFDLPPERLAEVRALMEAGK